MIEQNFENKQMGTPPLYNDLDIMSVGTPVENAHSVSIARFYPGMEVQISSNNGAWADAIVVANTDDGVLVRDGTSVRTFTVHPSKIRRKSEGVAVAEVVESEVLNSSREELAQPTQIRMPSFSTKRSGRSLITRRSMGKTLMND